ncbi:alpha/beta fold hydrolase [Streptomyces sp. NPDC001732]
MRREVGSGPPLGSCTAASSISACGGAIHVFAARHEVIAFDPREYGGSDNATGPFRPADDVAALLRGLDVLVGVSMGGATAVDCALEHPDLVREVVVSSVGTSEPSSRTWGRRISFRPRRGRRPRVTWPAG